MAKATQQQLIEKLKPTPVQKTARGIPKSLYDAVLERPDSFAKGLKGNTKIVDFGTFVIEFDKIMAKGKQSNARDYFKDDLEKDLCRIIFNTKTIRQVLTRNVGEVQANKIYAKPQTMPSQTTLTQVPAQTMFTKTQQVSGYTTKGGFTKRGYIRTNPQGFQPAQRKFLQVRRQRQQTAKSVLVDYRKTFPNDNRSNSAIKSKFYRQK